MFWTAAAERYWRKLVSLAEEDDQAADYVGSTLQIARIDLQNRYTPTEALAKLDTALARHRLETMSAVPRRPLHQRAG